MSDEQEIKKGSVGISQKSHDLLTSLVFDGYLANEDRPFTSIVEAFRFAFALGYNKKQKIESSGKKEGIAPRQFVVDNYLNLLLDELIQTNKSLGGLISEYAEGGCDIMQKHLSDSKSISELI
jgi:hypothetical protein